MRAEGRKRDEMRPVQISRNYQKFAAGSVLIEFGNTKVICSASFDNKVPAFMKSARKGWITAEYSILPGATPDRTQRDSSRGKVPGRSHEIQRMIGRALRAVVDLKSLGEQTVWLDCDVVQADGGTRTAAITGAWFALFDALMTQKRHEKQDFPIKDYLAAISAGMVNDQLLLDLDYSEDSQANFDLNVVITGQSKLVEIQGSAEKGPLESAHLQPMLDLTRKGIAELVAMQQEFAGEYFRSRLQVLETKK